MTSLTAPIAGDSAASRMPAELWLSVLELLDEDGVDIHIFDQSYEQRSARTRNFRALSLVCKSLSPLVISFICKHPTFEGIIKTDNSRTDKRWQILSFARSVGWKWNPGPVNSTWMETLFIHSEERRETPKDDIDRDLSFSLRKLLPRFTNLTAFACRMILSLDDFDKLTSAAGNSLRSLVVHFDYRVPKMLAFFSRLQNLQDLNLIIDQHLPLGPSTDVPSLPALRRLELTGKETDLIFLTMWLARMPPTSLEILRLHATTGLSINMLPTFLIRHCQDLSTLGMHRLSWAVMADMLSYAPRLRYLELSKPDEVIVFGLDFPASLQEITFTRPPYNLDAIQALVQALQQASMQDHLRTFRYSRVSKFADSRFGSAQALLWNKILGMLDPEQGDEWLMETLGPVRDSADALQESGKDFVDEDGVSLVEYLKDVPISAPQLAPPNALEVEATHSSQPGPYEWSQMIQAASADEQIAYLC